MESCVAPGQTSKVHPIETRVEVGRGHKFPKVSRSRNSGASKKTKKWNKTWLMGMLPRESRQSATSYVPCSWRIRASHRACKVRSNRNFPFKDRPIDPLLFSRELGHRLPSLTFRTDSRVPKRLDPGYTGEPESARLTRTPTARE